ncbi:cyclin-dependent kinase 20-like [Ornithodoros turicata]|uniref:cyclin-dependent kinase 20-like n=1 Tax=Ornithodoros turicata TaxID=34597 RepID=UPI003139CE75
MTTNLYKLRKQTSTVSKRMDDYQIMGWIGEGAHGIVLKAKCNHTNRTLALKKIPVTADSFSRSLLREVMALQHLRHKNVARLERVIAGSGALLLAMEFVSGHLGQLIYGMPPLAQAQIKGHLVMLLQGMEHCHTQGILHRDLKPSNLLVDSRGCLKIADFGLACLIPQGGVRSHRVATRWYRAPELLYGAQQYGIGVDLWSIGCIYAEMLGRRPLFKGESDIEQLCLVVKAMGTPTVDMWPGFKDLPDFKKIRFAPQQAQPLSEFLPDCQGQHTLSLLSRFLVYNPDQRITCAEALKHPYLFSEPMPTGPSLYSTSSETI